MKALPRGFAYFPQSVRRSFMKEALKQSIVSSNYDSINDILVLHFQNDRGNSYAFDEYAGFEFMCDIDTNELTGLIVYYPKRKEEERNRTLKSLKCKMNLKSYVLNR